MPLDLNEIQGNIVPGFGSRYQDFLFVRFGDQDAATRGWLQGIQASMTSAADVERFKQEYAEWKRRAAGNSAKPSATWLNVALSSHGLDVLNAPDRDQFPVDFRATSVRRAVRAGDMLAYPDPNDPGYWGKWAVGGTDTEPDALVILAAASSEQLDTARADALREMDNRGLHQVALYRGQRLDGKVEHFGFRDGISQPVPDHVTGAGWTSSGDKQIVAPGEFILGQPDETGATTFGAPGWASNGSYVVFRRLRQQVADFWTQMDAAVKALSTEQIDGLDRDIIGGKIMGRAPGQEGRLDKDLSGDPFGQKIPLFAHIRKANPRDRLLDGDPTQPNRHRIVRRGIPYTEGAETGLLFLAYQASIQRQFEHIQTEFLNEASFPQPLPTPGLQAVESAIPPAEMGRDPVAGVWGAGPTQVKYPRPGEPAAPPTFVTLALQRTVTVLGSGYFFTPSRRALGALAANNFQ